MDIFQFSDVSQIKLTISSKPKQKTYFLFFIYHIFLVVLDTFQFWLNDDARWKVAVTLHHKFIDTVHISPEIST